MLLYYKLYIESHRVKGFCGTSEGFGLVTLLNICQDTSFPNQNFKIFISKSRCFFYLYRLSCISCWYIGPWQYYNDHSQLWVFWPQKPPFSGLKWSKFKYFVTVWSNMGVETHNLAGSMLRYWGRRCCVWVIGLPQFNHIGWATESPKNRLPPDK